MRLYPLFVLAALLLAACSPRLIPYPEPTAAQMATPVSTAIVTPGSETEKVISLAISDLAARLAIDPGQVKLVLIESVLWPDSSLGCPQPGQAYSEVIVPGYQIYLQAEGQEYVYHSDAGEQVIACQPHDDLPDFPLTPGELDDGEPWMPVE